MSTETHLIYLQGDYLDNVLKISGLDNVHIERWINDNDLLSLPTFSGRYFVGKELNCDEYVCKGLLEQINPQFNEDVYRSVYRALERIGYDTHGHWDGEPRISIAPCIFTF